MKLLLKWLIMAASILIAAKLITGVAITGVWAALWLAVFLAVINLVIKPFLILITLPINILTLGLFTFVINALLVWFSSTIIKGFEVEGFLPALFFSVVLSVVSYLLSVLFRTK